MEDIEKNNFKDDDKEYPVNENPLPLTAQCIAEKYLEMRRLKKAGALTMDKKVFTYPKILEDL